MASEPAKRQREANIAAAVTVVFVALFAMAFVGLVSLLDDWAAGNSEKEEVAVGTAAPVDPFYVLLIGSDSRKGTAIYTGKADEHGQLDQHADIMTLMRIDPQQRVITLVTVPRDTVIDDQSPRLNDSLLQNNPADVVQAVGDLTGVYADYYMMTSFISFENLVNAVGGVDVSVPKTVSVTDPATGKSVKVRAGKSQHLNGAEALVLARARKEYATDQDALRQINVRNIERALIDKILKQNGSFDVEHVLTALEDDTKTNLDLPSAGLVMVDFVQHAAEVKIYDCTGPYDGGERAGDGLWVIENDENAWNRLMAVVNAGEDPAGIVELPPRS